MDYQEIRHHLHSSAELSGHETQTVQIIYDILSSYRPYHIYTFPGSCNLVAEFEFGPGKTILLRADMDALPINETIGLPYRSITNGVSHKCGHDGHTTILLGVAEQLYKHPLPSGKVLLFFQAAEETGKGAAQLLSTRFLDNYHIDYVFALHNIPEVEKNAIICKEHSFTCAVISCEINLKGKTSHASEPQYAISPFPAAVKITDSLSQLNVFDLKDPDYQIITLVEMHIGETAYGVSAGNGVLRFTMRAKSEQILQALKKQTEAIVLHEVSQTTNLEYELRWLEYFAGGENAPEAVALIKKVAENHQLSYISKDTPFTWGEDFGLLTQHYKGALFGLGSGTDCPPLHRPEYDFPDDIIETGVKCFYNLCLTV